MSDRPTRAFPARSERTYVVRIIPQQQYRDGKPFDVMADFAAAEIVVTDTPDDPEQVALNVAAGIRVLDERRAAQ